MSKDVGQRLMRLKEKIDQAKSNRDKAKGAEEELMKQLEERFHLLDLDEAEEVLEQLRLDGEKLGRDIAEQEKKLERSYEW